MYRYWIAFSQNYSPTNLFTYNLTSYREQSWENIVLQKTGSYIIFSVLIV